MTIDQKDIIETIDRLHAEATKASDLLRMAGVNPPSDIFALIRTVSTFNSEIHVNWPALRDRLREAERKAKAFDAIASGDVELYEIHRPAYWTVETTSDPLRAVSDPDLLTAIEAATREAKP